MSWKATAWVNGVTGITRSEKLLMFVLSDRYNEDEGCARPSMLKLAEESLMSPRTAQRVVASLQKKNKITIEERSGKTSLYRFPGHSRGDVLTGVSEATGDKKCLPYNPTHVKIDTDPRQHGGGRTEENRDDDEPIDDRGHVIDTTQDILPWIIRRWEEFQSNQPKSSRKKVNLGKFPDQFEKQEEEIGRIRYRRRILRYIYGPDNRGMVSFAIANKTIATGRRTSTFRPAAELPSNSGGMSAIERVRALRSKT